nr:DUF805 domain-containing protein [Qipengyuania polymorpha]
MDIPHDLARTVRSVFDFHGRSRRTEVWTYLLVWNLALQFTLGLLLKLGFDIETEDGKLTLFAGLVTFAYLAPLPALIARRAHDIGWTGWTAVAVPFTVLVSVLDENGSPSLAGIEKQDLGLLVWVSSAAFLLILLIALLPPHPKASVYGPNPRLNEVADS